MHWLNIFAFKIAKRSFAPQVRRVYVCQGLRHRSFELAILICCRLLTVKTARLADTFLHTAGLLTIIRTKLGHQFVRGMALRHLPIVRSRIDQQHLIKDADNVGSKVAPPFHFIPPHDRIAIGSGNWWSHLRDNLLRRDANRLAHDATVTLCGCFGSGSRAAQSDFPVAGNVGTMHIGLRFTDDVFEAVIGNALPIHPFPFSADVSNLPREPHKKSGIRVRIRWIRQ